MTDFILDYKMLEMVANYSKSLGKRADEYSCDLESKIISGISTVTGPSSGFLLNASDSVRDKITALKQKSEAFYQFAEQIIKLLEVAEQMDQEVADAIAISRGELEYHKTMRLEDWKAKLIDLLVDIKNDSPLLATIADILGGTDTIPESLKDSIKHCYECEGGKRTVKGEFGHTEAYSGLATIGLGVIDLFNGNVFKMLKNGLFSRIDLNYGKENGNVELKNNIKKSYSKDARNKGTGQDITNNVGHIISNVEICVGFVSTKAETYYFDDAGNRHFRGYYTPDGQVLIDEYGMYPIKGSVEKHSFKYLNIEIYKNPNGETFNIDALSAREGKSQSFVRDTDEIYSTIDELSDLNFKNRYKTAWKWTQAGVSAAMDISTIVTFGTAAAGTTSVKAGLLAGSKTLIKKEAIVQSAGVNGLMMAGDKVFYNEKPSSSSALNFIPIVATIYAIDSAMNNDEAMQGAFVDSDYVKVFIDSLK